MTRTIRDTLRKNLLIVSILFTAVFLVINGSLYLVNRNFLLQKIEEENQAFLELTTHILNENDLAVGLEYIEHYTHIHEVEIEIVDDDGTMLYSSAISYRYSDVYEIDTLQGKFKIFIDNTESVTTNIVNTNFLYVNVTLIAIYLASIGVFVAYNRHSLRSVERDLQQILTFLHENDRRPDHLVYSEFREVYTVLSNHLEELDTLREQRLLNIHGLAHDIKTPLTVIYNYLDDHGHARSTIPSQTVLDAAHQINHMVDDLIQDNYSGRLTTVHLDEEVAAIVERYEAIFATRDMTIRAELEPVVVRWTKQDATRIVENLLSNAFYYSIPATAITITLRATPHASLVVSSVPIDEDIDIDHLFDKGYRSDRGGRNQSGKGLGLYLCRLLLKPIDGHIRVEHVDGTISFVIDIGSS